MTIDEAREDIETTAQEIQRLLNDLQTRVGSDIESVSVSIVSCETFGDTRMNSYIGRVRIRVYV